MKYIKHIDYEDVQKDYPDIQKAGDLAIAFGDEFVKEIVGQQSVYVYPGVANVLSRYPALRIMNDAKPEPHLIGYLDATKVYVISDYVK